jgi:hypothetical protein
MDTSIQKPKSSVMITRVVGFARPLLDHEPFGPTILTGDFGFDVVLPVMTSRQSTLSILESSAADVAGKRLSFAILNRGKHIIDSLRDPVFGRFDLRIGGRSRVMKARRNRRRAGGWSWSKGRGFLRGEDRLQLNRDKDAEKEEAEAGAKHSNERDGRHRSRSDEGARIQRARSQNGAHCSTFIARPRILLVQSCLLSTRLTHAKSQDHLHDRTSQCVS